MTDDFATTPPRADRGARPSLQPMAGRSTAMLEIGDLIDKIANTDMSACVWGESGTGKNLVGRVIHDRSARRGGPFVVVNCTTRPEETIETRLFGPLEPALNGARTVHGSMLALAHTGTLVLDELPALGPRLQTRLLEALRTRRLPESGGALRRFSARLITTMSTDPVRAVEEGRLNEDLYYRVAVVLVRMPALRERPEDIPLLVEHLLRRFAARYRRPMVPLAVGIVERMMPLPWPGNVRQLEDLLRHAFLLTNGDVITDQDLSRAAMALEREGGVNPLRRVS